MIALVAATSYHHKYASAFSPITCISRNDYRNNSSQTSHLKRISTFKASLAEEDEATKTKTVTNPDEIHNGSSMAEIGTLNDSHVEVNDNWIVKNLKEKIGKVDENRMAVPEFANGEIDRIFR